MSAKTETKKVKAPVKKGAKKVKESLYKSHYDEKTGEWVTQIDEDVLAKRKEAERLRKEREALLVKVVSEKGASALHHIDPLTISFRLLPDVDLNSIDAFTNPCVEVDVIVNPLMDAVLQKVGMTRRGRRSYSISLGKHTDSLTALFNALPGDRIYTPEELSKVVKKGKHAQTNFASCSLLNTKLAGTEAGAKANGLYGAISSRTYNHEHRSCDAHWAIQASTNGKELFLRFVTFGNEESKGEAFFLYEGAPSLNLLTQETTHDPIKVTADVAVALYSAAQKFGYEVADYEWMDSLTAAMRGAVIAQAIPGAPGEARLLVGANVPEIKGISLTPLIDSGEILYTQDTCEAIGKAMENLPDGVMRVMHPAVADVIEMTQAPLIQYREVGKRHYQNEVIRLHRATKIGFVNTMAVGLGKTITTLLGFKARFEDKTRDDELAAYRALVVMQMDKMDEWQDECDQHFEEARTFILHGTKKKNLDALAAEVHDAEITGEPLIVFTSYETVKDADEFLGQWWWDDMAVDEAVVLVSTSAGRSKAMWSLRKRAGVGVALTGTPIERSLDDLGRMLAWARNEEEMFYGRRLSTRYDVSQESHLDALWRALGPTVIRFDRSELAKIAAEDEGSDEVTALRLPKIKSQVVPLTPSAAEKALADGTRHHMASMYEKLLLQYEQAAQMNPDDELLAEAKEDLRKIRGAVLGSVTLARIGASDPRALRDSDSLGVTLLDVEGLIEPVVNQGSTKSKWLVETLKPHVAKNESCLVFTDFSSVADHIAADLKKAGMKVECYKGSVTRAKRTELRHRFMGRPCEKHLAQKVTGAAIGCADCTQPDLDVLVLTKAAYKGLNLQRASVLVHYDLPWLPSDVVQRLGRASRDGAQNDVLTVYVPLMKGTIEERVAALLLPRAITAMMALDGYRGVDVRETELGMSMAGLAEQVSEAEQAETGKISIFELAKKLLDSYDENEASKPKKKAA